MSRGPGIHADHPSIARIGLEHMDDPRISPAFEIKDHSHFFQDRTVLYEPMGPQQSVFFPVGEQEHHIVLQGLGKLQHPGGLQHRRHPGPVISCPHRIGLRVIMGYHQYHLTVILSFYSCDDIIDIPCQGTTPTGYHSRRMLNLHRHSQLPAGSFDIGAYTHIFRGANRMGRPGDFLKMAISPVDRKGGIRSRGFLRRRSRRQPDRKKSYQNKSQE